MLRFPRMSSFDIVIDPGHGNDAAVGHSSPTGVRGPSGTVEKDVALRLADRLADALTPLAGRTRADDSNLSLAARAEVARAAQARVFLSLHANGGAAGERGAEAWIHDRASAGSRSLAARILAALDALPDAPASRGVKTGTMAVLTPERLPPDTAACLLEVDFLSTPEGERRLTDDGALDAIAAVLARALRDHLSARPMPSPPPLLAGRMTNGKMHAPGRHELYDAD